MHLTNIINTLRDSYHVLQLYILIQNKQPSRSKVQRDFLLNVAHCNFMP